jgi:hypothetical protein
MNNHIYIKFFPISIIILILFINIRGIVGNPAASDLNSNQWQTDGPFELSPERGRFALTYSFIEEKSLYFSLPIARFVAPDLGYKNGHYVSLFAPGVSFIIAPGYYIGKLLGASQVGAFGIITLFACMNALLIRSIAIRLKVHPLAATLGSYAFIFASPAFAYAVTLYQHHVSTFLILASIYLLMISDSLWSAAILWFLFAASVPVDYPNLILMLPIAVSALGKIILVKTNVLSCQIRVKMFNVLTVLSGIIPLLFFLWFNQMSFGNPLQLSGTVPRVKEVGITGNNVQNQFTAGEENKTAVGFFQTRNLINGLYIHLFSPDRGTVNYTPVMLFGIIGLIILYRRRNPYLPLIAGVILANLLLYSMWGDPWGGWAFGSRYMIPAYAMLAIGLSLALDAIKKHKIYLFLFFIILVYSIAVNTLGAITTSTNPPQAEILALEQITGHEEKYTYMRNVQYLATESPKSFVYRTWIHQYLTGWQYYVLLVGVISIVSLCMIFGLIRLRGISRPASQRGESSDRRMRSV